MWQTKTSGHDWQTRCRIKKCQSHGQKKWTKTRFSTRPWKDELDNGNTVHQEVQNTNSEDWGIACRH